MRITTLLLLLIVSVTTSFTQEVYQISVNKGLGLRASFLAATWNNENISDKQVICPGLDVTITAGITESFGVYGGYQQTFEVGLAEKELDFLLTTQNVKNQNYLLGLRYVPGSTSSSFRFNVHAGIIFATTDVQMFDDHSDLSVDIRLKGPGVNAGLGVSYFVSPFLSLDLTAGYVTGKYKVSEFLGITHKENVSYTNIQGLLGLHYHFKGR